MNRTLWGRLCCGMLVGVFVCAAPYLSAQEDHPQDNGPRDNGIQSESLYRLLLRADAAELREACRARGLSEEGGLNELSRRLIEHETAVPGEPGEEPPGENRLVLRQARFMRSRESDDENLVLLEGEVVLLHGTRRIQADRVEINTTRRMVTGSGNVRFVEGNSLYLGERFSYQLDPGRGFFLEASTAIDKFVYTGRVIKKIDTGDKYVADSVTLSTCTLDHPHYRIDADRLFYYDQERVLIKGASVYYGQDEVVRLPYLYRNLREKKLKTAFLYRDRSGLIVQNTYQAVDTDARLLVLKGDFYERLGLYAGADFASSYPRGETGLQGSAALSNDVYFYEQVSKNWSPLGPPPAEVYDIDRSLRYRAGLYQKYVLEGSLTNTTELDLQWISDPYYQFDFERRSTGFDLFELLAQQESDYPRMGSGYTMYLNNTLEGERFTASLRNRLRMEPKRNTEVEEFSLPEYYRYRPSTLTAPSLSVVHSADLFPGGSGAFSDLAYTGTGSYANVLYYEQDQVSEQVHSGQAAVSARKDYFAGDLLRFTPDLEVGAEAQSHVDGDGEELADDRRKSYLYGRTTGELRVGPSGAYVLATHDLKYKLAGPDDQYTYHRFRTHDLGLTGFVRVGPLSNEVSTAYDLRPVYDWTSGAYQPVGLDRNRFDPLRNTVTFTPSDRLTLKDVLVYDIAESRASTNQLNFSVSSGEFSVWNNPVTLSWDLDWYHYFVNPTLDTLDSTFRLDVSFRYMSAYFKVLSRNEDLWRYFPSAARDRGLEPINPVVDLVKSFNFFDREDREESNFKLKAISFGVIRDLHDWELKLDYTGSRALSYDGTRYVWDNLFSISIGLREVESVKAHATFTDRQ